MSSPSLPSEIVNTLVPQKEDGSWIDRIAVSLDVAAKVAVACVLITTAVLKLASIVFSTATTGSFRSGNRSMVLPFIPEGMELIAVTVLEVVVFWFFVRASNALMRYATVAWISTCFLGYRYILHVIGTDSRAPDIGFSVLPDLFGFC